MDTHHGDDLVLDRWANRNQLEDAGQVKLSESIVSHARKAVDVMPDM